MNKREHQEVEQNKVRNISLCLLFLSMIFGLFIATLLKKEATFSSSENRVLQTKPAFSLETLFEGSYTSEYEAYITDQFVMRDQWIALKVYAEMAIQKKAINGVYFGEDGYLIQEHLATDVDQALVDLNLNRLDQFVNTYKDKLNVQVLIAPTASYVLSDKVPKYANEYDQAALLAQMGSMIGENHLISVADTLKEHAKEAIYYRTDHHWTSLGAYYAYVQWAHEMGITPYTKEEFEVEEVTKDFLGTTYSKVNIPTKPDSIHLYTLKEPREYLVTLNMDKNTTLDGLYDWDKLKEKDKYPVFLGGNNAYVDIESNVKNGKTLLVVKDSYAHTFVPFLANHYERIIMIDYRYYNGSTQSVIEEQGVTDVLFMYNTMNFVTDKNFIKVLK